MRCDRLCGKGKVTAAKQQLTASHLLELHNVRVHKTPMVLDFPLNILRDLHMTTTNAFRRAGTPKVLSAIIPSIVLLG